jgi:hypothetical protein
LPVPSFKVKFKAWFWEKLEIGYSFEKMGKRNLFTSYSSLLLQEKCAITAISNGLEAWLLILYQWSEKKHANTIHIFVSSKAFAGSRVLHLILFGIILDQCVQPLNTYLMVSSSCDYLSNLKINIHCAE